MTRICWNVNPFSLVIPQQSDTYGITPNTNGGSILDQPCCHHELIYWLHHVNELLFLFAEYPKGLSQVRHLPAIYRMGDRCLTPTNYEKGTPVFPTWMEQLLSMGLTDSIVQWLAIAISPVLVIGGGLSSGIPGNLTHIFSINRWRVSI